MHWSSLGPQLYMTNATSSSTTCAFEAHRLGVGSRPQTVSTLQSLHKYLFAGLCECSGVQVVALLSNPVSKRVVHSTPPPPLFGLFVADA
jgi:hypothetical protein